MSIESMNKAELVKELRVAQQELKLAQSRIQALENNQAKNEQAESQLVEQLPYQGVSLLRTKDKKFLVVRLRFDLDGRSRVVSVEDMKKDYMAYTKAEEILSTEIDAQVELEKDVIQEMEEEVTEDENN